MGVLAILDIFLSTRLFTPVARIENSWEPRYNNIKLLIINIY